MWNIAGAHILHLSLSHHCHNPNLCCSHPLFLAAASGMLYVYYTLSHRHVVCMLAYRMPIVCSLLAVDSFLLSFCWIAECFPAVFMLPAYRSACRMLAVFVLFAEFADSVACRTAHCQHAIVRVAIMRPVCVPSCVPYGTRWLAVCVAGVSVCPLVVCICIVSVCWCAICCSYCFTLDYLPTVLVVLVCLPERAGIFLCPLEYHYRSLHKEG